MDPEIVPVVCAGDVFDRWNPPPELINFALKELPHLHAVPGQHDLAHHNLADIRKSGYWTLVEAGKITHLHAAAAGPVEVAGVAPLRLHGFPWGVPVTPLADPCDLALDVAVVHAYCWGPGGTCYQGAPDEAHVMNHRRKGLRGYDLAVFGDNHVPFYLGGEGRHGRKVPVYNCGGFFRRKSDEKGHRPSVGLLRSDGSVTRHHLDVSQDRFVDDAREAAAAPGLEGLLEELGRLADRGIDFAAAVRRALDREDAPPAVRAAVLKALEGDE